MLQPAKESTANMPEIKSDSKVLNNVDFTYLGSSLLASESLNIKVSNYIANASVADSTREYGTIGG